MLSGSKGSKRDQLAQVFRAIQRAKGCIMFFDNGVREILFYAVSYGGAVWTCTGFVLVF